jgi:hypothetical protein
LFYSLVSDTSPGYEDLIQRELSYAKIEKRVTGKQKSESAKSSMADVVASTVAYTAVLVLLVSSPPCSSPDKDGTVHASLLSAEPS